MQKMTTKWQKKMMRQIIFDSDMEFIFNVSKSAGGSNGYEKLRVFRMLKKNEF